MSLLAAAGCGASTVDSGGDDDPNNPDNPDDPAVPLTAEGRFNVQSEFDLATNVPGTPGTVINYFIAATDDPDDPTKFLVDELIKALPAGSVKNFAQSSAPFVTGYLNQRLLEVAPQLLDKIIDIGNAFGDVAKHFGTLETLEINAAGQAVKTIVGFHFEIDQVPMDFMLKDYGIAEIRVEGVQVMLEQSGKLTILDHKVGISYGAALKLAIDKAIIPMIDPSAQNVGDILKKAVNCQKVGQYVYEALNFGSASTYQSACTAGLGAASSALYSKLAGMDGSALELGITGVARAVDKNRDGKMDDIQTGSWTGNLGYAGSPAALPAGATFFGAKM
ncbi:MAG: hypothetical protein M4D80_25175 [Myxococcota bacterium]|nr:hypothetical protein [Myxococcota bacterium]